MTKRCHTMPFGAEPADSGVRFRLWAPGASSVEVCLEDTAAMLPMVQLEGGWYELFTPQASRGSRYRFRIDGDLRVADPASRYNPKDVQGPSVVWDAQDFDWQDDDWRGRPWDEAVIYELHVGTFSAAGTFAGVAERLDYLQGLGVTVIELMPVADFPGRRGWGYDGVLPFAPEAAYGTPDDLKALVQAAHRCGLMVMLDVVYNHFGPEGNYLPSYAPDFFNPAHLTPWGSAINYDAPPACRIVRDFFVHNALYWLEEFHFDGLRLDAVHAIADDSREHFLDELARRVRERFGGSRAAHLVLENDDNGARFLARDPHRYDAQWNDDYHHAAHVIVAGERDGYYADYADDPARRLGRCLAEGFAYQNDPSPFRGGQTRGEKSAHLPPAAFVDFLQNHDQVGNRALGERLSSISPPAALRALQAITLLAPQPPLVFMGEEFAAASPFLYFCDFSGELADAVREGRRREFARFAAFADEKARAHIPDPNSEVTFVQSRLDWDCLDRPPHDASLERFRMLLDLRRREIIPRLAGTQGHAGGFQVQGPLLTVSWVLGDGSRLHLRANLSDDPAPPGGKPPSGRRLYSSGPLPEGDELPGWHVDWHVQEGEAR